MKERTLIGDLSTHIGETVSISGWVDVRRDQGKMVFFDFRDRSGKVQGVVLPNSSALETAKEVRNEYVVRVEGVVNKRPGKNAQEGKQNGDIELEIQSLHLLSAAEALPFDTDADINLDTLLDYRPLTIRRDRERAIFKVQHEIVSGFREYLDKNGFTEFQAPKLVGDDAEGGAGVFKVEYFKDKSAYLATSPQLYKQMMVGAFERVYATGPQFRAEKHSTTRHLNEISMLDFEMGFINDHRDVMQMVEGALKHVTKRLAENAKQEFLATGATLPLVPESFPVLKLREAQEILNVPQEPDLEPEHERNICEWAQEHKQSDFVFITHYPVSKRPFYTMEDPEDPGFTKSFDLLFRGVEILSGGQRVHDYAALQEKIRAKGLDPEKFSFYLMAFKYGLPPHGGIGMGLERLTQKYLGIDNVKEATLFPRDMNRIDTLLSEGEN
ncbi:MAG: nondiscriminating aspartyl-tRNA synthetase [Parcubacteria group bacterium Gr01-1014_49]|nr:MAG: nondiscriminating aspartyl-tRNA synthetase [Parcubacteria group bacterium Gr01-1014_49]